MYFADYFVSFHDSQLLIDSLFRQQLYFVALLMLSGDALVLARLTVAPHVAKESLTVQQLH